MHQRNSAFSSAVSQSPSLPPKHLWLSDGFWASNCISDCKFRELKDRSSLQGNVQQKAMLKYFVNMKFTSSYTVGAEKHTMTKQPWSLSCTESSADTCSSWGQRESKTHPIIPHLKARLQFAQCVLWNIYRYKAWLENTGEKIEFNISFLLKFPYALSKGHQNVNICNSNASTSSIIKDHQVPAS